MKTFISLLRGINVSGQNRVNMPELKRAYEALGLTNVRTYIQSGNVVFECAEQDPGILAERIEVEIARTFGCSVRVLLRDQNQFQRILEGNPFLHERSEDPEKLYVTFLAGRPSEAILRQLIAPAGIPDEFRACGQEIHVFCPNGYGKTRISNTFFEKKLGIPATTRNWKTVNALYEILVTS